MATKQDVRQAEIRVLLDQISSATPIELDTALIAVNSELTPPGRLRASTTPDLVLVIDSGTVTDPNTLRVRSLPPIASLVPTFTGGTITFPSTTGGTITVSPGTNSILTCPSGQFVKVLVQIDQAGNLSVVVGTAAGSSAAAVVPAGNAGILSLGYVIISNVAGTIQNVINANCVQFVGGGGGATGSSGIINYINNSDAEVNTMGWVTYSDTQTVTITNASPAVFTTPANHNLVLGQKISFTTTGTLPNPINETDIYFVASIDSLTTYKVSVNQGLSPFLDTTTNGTGVHTQRPLSPISGTGAGSFSGMAFSRSTSSPLRGVASFLLAQTLNSITTGTGVSYNFTIDSADQAKVLSITFDYNVDSTYTTNGPYNDSDLEVFVLDVTNNILIPVSSNKLDQKGTSNFNFKGTFQTSSNSTSYRLILHVVGVNNLGWNFKFDNVSVGPQTILFGSPVSDWTQYSPATSGFSLGNGTKNAYWRRVGDSMEIMIDVIFGSTSSFSGAFEISIPSGFTIDGNKLPSSATNIQSLGSALGFISASANYSGTVLYDTTTQIRIAGPSSGDVWGPIYPNTWNTTSYLSLIFTVPISGWSSNTVSSSDTDTRVVALVAHLGANVSPTAGTAIKYDTVDNDTHGSYNTSTGEYTVPVSGFYHIEDIWYSNASATEVVVYKNGIAAVILGEAPANQTRSGSTTIYANAGDTISIVNFSGTVTYNFGLAPNDNQVSITRVSGPATIAASESVNMRYVDSSSSITSSFAAVTYSTKDYDSHNAYSGGIYTIPVSGKYLISARLVLAATSGSTTDACEIQIYKNNTTSIGTKFVRYILVGPTSASCDIVDTVNCIAGDTIQIRALAQSSAQSISAGADLNALSIQRVGN